MVVAVVVEEVGAAIPMPRAGTTHGAMTPTHMLLHQRVRRHQVSAGIQAAKVALMPTTGTVEVLLKIITALHQAVLVMIHAVHHRQWIGTAGIRTRQARIHTTAPWGRHQIAIHMWQRVVVPLQVEAAAMVLHRHRMAAVTLTGGDTTHIDHPDLNSVRGEGFLHLFCSDAACHNSGILYW